MTELSSYVNYLPPILWSTEIEKSQFLGRMLRIFEEILTGLPIHAQVVQANAPFALAANQSIRLANPADVDVFRAGDLITIEGSIESAQIAHIAGGELVLASSLTSTFTSGTVRVADLQPGQQTLRVDNLSQLGAEVVVEISQGIKSEIGVIAAVEGEFIQLYSGLHNGYSMGHDHVPVRLTDGLPLVHGDHVHAPLAATIAQLTQLFNPRATRSEFLPWLASWVALTLRTDLSEYQQRKLIADVVPMYRQRGLKAGLLAYLDLFSVTNVRPRIVIDAGEAVFHARFSENGAAQLHPIAYSTNFPLPGNKAMTALLYPSALAVDTRNNAYIIADLGDSQRSRQPAIWRIAANTGALEYTAGAAPLPKPLYLRNQAVTPRIDVPVAIVVDAAPTTDRYCVLDAGEGTVSSASPAIYRLTAPDFVPVPVIDKSTTPKFAAVMPVDMVQGPDRSFVVLDRGVRLSGEPPSGGPAKSKLIVVKEGPPTLTREEHALNNLPDADPAKVIEPTALVIDAQGRYIVADARDQSSTQPANLVLVDPADNWSQHALLPDTDNPLVYPTGLVFENPQSLLVCDTGLRNGFVAEQLNFRTLAEPPALYRIDLTQSPPKISKITTAQSLVSPTKMAIDQNRDLIITDRGESLRDIQNQQRNWRTQPHEFGVIIHFSSQRPGAADAIEANRIRKQICHTVTNIVEEQKPGHVAFWLKS